MFKPHVRICLAAFTLDFAVMIGITATPFFVLKQLGGTAQTTGYFGAVQSAAYATAALVSAGLVARTKNGMSWAVGGVFVYTIFYSIMPLFDNWAICLAVTSVASAALSLAWPAMHSWVGAEPDPAVRAKTMSWFNISWSFGFSISPLLAGAMYDAHYGYPFVALAVLAFAALALIWSLPHESSHFAEPTEELLIARAEHDRSSEAFLLAGWCATFVANMLAGAVRSIYPKRIDDLITAGELRVLWETTPPAFLTSAPATNYSLLACSFSFATALMFLLLGRTTWWRHRFGFLFWMQVASAAALFMLARTQSLVIMCASCAVVGAFLGLAFFSATYYSLANPARKHGRAAINEAAVGFGGFAGSLVCGYVAEHYGITTPFRYAPAILGIALLSQWVLLKYQGRRVPDPAR